MPFVKGDPNINRKGRPPGFSIVGHLKEKLQEIPKGQKETYATLITRKYLHKALVEGDSVVLKDLINRVDGLPRQPLDHAGEITFLLDLGEKNGEN
jgi:hypothetical protein